MNTLPHRPIRFQVHLTPGIRGVHVSGETMFTHRYTSPMGNGVVRTIPRNDGKMLHIEYIGPESTSPGEVGNTEGPGNIREIMRQLAPHYPQAEFVSGLRAGGAKPGRIVREIPGRGGSRGRLQRRPIRFMARPHVPFSEVRNSLWGNPRHRSGLSQSGRFLQKMVSVHKNPDVRALAANALRGDTMSLRALQDKLDELGDHWNGFHWGDAADYADLANWNWQKSHQLDQIIRGIPGRHGDPESRIADVLDQARRSHQRHHLKSAVMPHLSILASHLARTGQYPILTDAIQRYIRGGGSLINANSLSGDVSESYGDPNGLVHVFSRPGVSNEGPVTWVSVQRKYPMGGKWTHSFAVQNLEPNETEPPAKLRRRFAKVDGHVEAHPLVAGFPIEHALRHLANDPKNSDNIRDLAKVAVTGGPKGDATSGALWALNDALQEENHPAAKWYNWMSAADKIHLDQHTYRAFQEAAEDNRRHGTSPYTDEWSMSPEGHAIRASYALEKPSRSPRFGRMGAAHVNMLNQVRARVAHLVPGIDKKLIDESIRRHAHRARYVWLKRGGLQTGDAEKLALRPIKGSKNIGAMRDEMATRYRRPLRFALNARGDFIEALRRIRSSNQTAFRHSAQQIAQRLGLRPVDTVDALHDTPQGSTPGIAQAIYGMHRPEDIHAAAAWYGLTNNSPGVAIFHPRPNGPDALYRFRQSGSGLDIRAKLDRFGLTNRVLIPHRTGFDVLIPDKGKRQAMSVQSYARTHGVQLQMSPGHFNLIGSKDQAAAREKFRNVITRTERMQRGPKRYSAVDDMRGFHKAIHDDPEELTHPLVYADWLEDNGMPTVASIIREHSNAEGVSPNDRAAYIGATGGVVSTLNPGGFRAVSIPQTSFTEPDQSIVLQQRSVSDPSKYFAWIVNRGYPSEAAPLLESLVKEGVRLSDATAQAYKIEQPPRKLRRRYALEVPDDVMERNRVTLEAKQRRISAAAQRRYIDKINAQPVESAAAKLVDAIRQHGPLHRRGIYQKTSLFGPIVDRAARHAGLKIEQRPAHPNGGGPLTTWYSLSGRK